MSTGEVAKAAARLRLPAATRATYVAFISCGFALASWAARIPQIRDRLHLTSADLGLVLLAIAAGSIAALLAAGVIVSRFRSRPTVTAMAALQGVALAALGLGYLVGVVPVVIALFIFGFSAGAWDVAMNVQGAAVERQLGRAFLASMTVGRWFADHLLVRYGRVTVIRGQAVLAIAGVLLFVFSPATPLAFVGVLLWGLGASLGFPVGMSAAADDPAAAAGRVSVVASIGYCAFLGGPPLIGYLGQDVTVLRALVAVAVVLALATLVTGALRPHPRSAPNAQPPAHTRSRKRASREQWSDFCE